MQSNSDAKHKAEILATRKGGFGSSDAWLIIDIATIGRVLPKHYERLAVYDGIIEPNDYSSKEMETGNQREREIFEYLKEKNTSDIWISNPTYFDNNNILSDHFKCFSHIDIEQKTKTE